MTSRRRFLKAAAAYTALLAWSPLARSQKRPRRIGFLGERGPSDAYYARNLGVFKAGLRDLGYSEDRDYVIVHRYAENDRARLIPAAAELVAEKVDLIVTSGTPSAIAAHKVTRDIPILITTAADPVADGLAASLRRPGGNVTGLTSNSSVLSAKRLDLLRQVVPSARQVGYLYNPQNTNDVAVLKQLELDGQKLQIRWVLVPVLKESEIASAFGVLHREQAHAVMVSNASTNAGWRETIVAHAAKHRLPAIYAGTAWAELGGLVSYAASLVDLWRRAAPYADKLLRGAKPGDLPIEQPTKFELVINAKTAKSLGLAIPPTLLALADKVIE